MEILPASTTDHPILADAFDPAKWAIAEPVPNGGRGGSWFVGDQSPDQVLREYRRGGLLGKVITHLYLHAGRSRVRAIKELVLLKKLHAMGLPVPLPIAAAYRKTGLLFYRAWIIVKRIDGARTFTSMAADLTEQQLNDVGQVIRRFHDHGLDHADLNCNNILLANGDIYLIDFDKCRLRDAADKAWKARNLRRLKRSLRKVLPDISDHKITQIWDALLAGYSGQP